MGIIKKQGIRSAVFTYVGVAFGFFNNVFLLPNLLDTEEVGLISFLLSLTSIFAGVFALGLSFVTSIIFPKLQMENKSVNLLISTVFIGSLVGAALSSLAYFSLGDILFSEKNTADTFHLFTLGFIVVSTFKIIFTNADSAIRMSKNVVFGTIMESLVVKIVIFGILVYIYFNQSNSFSLFFALYIFALSIPGIFSVFYLIKKRLYTFDFKRSVAILSPYKNQILLLAFFGILNVLGSRIILEIDRIMVGNMISLDFTAVYSIAFLFGTFINIPAMGIKRISAVLISKAWTCNDLLTIEDIYKKSSLNLGIIGGYLFLGIWLNIDQVFTLLPPIYSTGKYVVLIIGISQFIDMLFGVNNEVLAYSKYYKYTTIFLTLLIFLVIILNLILIPILGIEGAAFSSLAAMTAVNMLRYLFLYLKFNFQPFSWPVLITLMVTTLFFGLNYILPELDHPIMNMILISSVLTVVYWPLIYLLKLSPDVNKLIRQYVTKFLGSKKMH